MAEIKRLVSYDSEHVTSNINVSAKRCNGIIFRNGGDVDATINDIPLPAGEFNDDFANNFPGDYIENDFAIAFKPGGSGTNKLVTATRIFKTIQTPATAEDCKPKK